MIRIVAFRAGIVFSFSQSVNDPTPNEAYRLKRSYYGYWIPPPRTGVTRHWCTINYLLHTGNLTLHIQEYATVRLPILNKHKLTLSAV